MKRLLALVCLGLCAAGALAQPVIQTTPYTRTLLRSGDAAEARTNLGVNLTNAGLFYSSTNLADSNEVVRPIFESTVAAVHRFYSIAYGPHVVWAETNGVLYPILTNVTGSGSVVLSDYGIMSYPAMDNAYLLGMPAQTNWTEANHTHASVAQGGILPEAAVPGLTNRVARSNWVGNVSFSGLGTGLADNSISIEDDASIYHIENEGWDTRILFPNPTNFLIGGPGGDGGLSYLSRVVFLFPSGPSTMSLTNESALLFECSSDPGTQTNMLQLSSNAVVVASVGSAYFVWELYHGGTGGAGATTLNDLSDVSTNNWTNGFVLGVTDGSWSPVPVTATAGGNNLEAQYNLNGSLAGMTNVFFNPATGRLVVTNKQGGGAILINNSGGVFMVLSNQHIGASAAWYLTHGGTNAWMISPHLRPALSNTMDIGTPTLFVRTVYVGHVTMAEGFSVNGTNATGPTVGRMYRMYADDSNYDGFEMAINPETNLLQSITAGDGTNNVSIELKPAGTGSVIVNGPLLVTGTLTTTNGSIYVDGQAERLTGGGADTNIFNVDCDFAERYFPGTNHMRFSNVVNFISGTVAFPCFLVTNFTASAMGIHFPATFKRYGGFPNPTNIAAGKTARVAFEVRNNTNFVGVAVVTD